MMMQRSNALPKLIRLKLRATILPDLTVPGGRDAAPAGIGYGYRRFYPVRDRHGRRKISQIRHTEPPCGAASRSRHRRPRRADLPDHELRLPRQRSCRSALQSRGARLYLFAHRQSDGRRARGAPQRARGRRRCDLHRQRPGGAASRHRNADGGGRSHRRSSVALWRLDQPVEAHPAALRDRDELCRSARSRRLPRRGTAGNAARLRRGDRQSRARGARPAGRRCGRA
jgi:hypothetical protein